MRHTAILKDSSNMLNPGAQRTFSKHTMARPMTASNAADYPRLPSASGETSLFLNFVQLLSSKTPEEQKMLLQVAMLEANGGGAAHAEPHGLASRGMRRTASAADVHLGVRSAHMPRGAVGLLRGSPSAAHLRPQSADTSGGGSLWAAAAGKQLSQSLTLAPRAHPAAALRAPLSLEAMRERLHAQLRRRAAATALQAHWRGWQHRRLARFLRARRKRHARLHYLWHLDYVHRLLVAHRACTFIQSRWRGRAARRAAAARATPRARDAPAPHAASPAKRRGVLPVHPRQPAAPTERVAVVVPLAQASAQQLAAPSEHSLPLETASDSLPEMASPRSHWSPAAPGARNIRWKEALAEVCAHMLGSTRRQAERLAPHASQIRPYQIDSHRGQQR
ncbi:hypothetical protein AB1Y20_015095 [Prymnesium parvum]|uniref:Uncharacterized protein n=1 Tax=Prymnesium parvum TaxID=97485 RepID=A0AB34JZR8_PRYPA